MTVARTSQSSTAPNPWILNPVLDLLLCCGGLFWLLIGIIAFIGLHPALVSKPLVVAIVVAGSICHHIFNDPHHPATLHRAYSSATSDRTIRLKVTVLAFIALAVALSIYYVHSTSILCIKLIVAWGIYHQLAQSYGIALIYCFKRGVILNRFEKLIITGLVNNASAYLILRMFSAGPYNASPTVLGLVMPAWSFVPTAVTSLSLIVLQLNIVAFLTMVACKYARDKVLFPLPAALTLFTLIVMPFVVGTTFSFVWVWLSTVFFHSSQYLVVSAAYYLKERGLPENVPLHKIASMLKTSIFIEYFLGIVLGGFALSYILPRVLAHGGGDKLLIFAAVWAFLNLHHYATDSLLWKLRDPATRRLLIS
ncbi:MAG: hypothetical protein JST01_16365 [Cyanobacteria bacterium SZAS TMP-1]|nr:hypothetical protein [Cyanobacteria bacterium SZAS TMP-1]